MFLLKKIKKEQSHIMSLESGFFFTLMIRVRASLHRGKSTQFVTHLYSVNKGWPFLKSLFFCYKKILRNVILVWQWTQCTIYRGYQIDLGKRCWRHIFATSQICTYIYTQYIETFSLLGFATVKIQLTGDKNGVYLVKVRYSLRLGRCWFHSWRTAFP